LAHEFRAWINHAFGQKLEMFRLGIFRAQNVQRELKWNLLVRTRAIKQRNRRANGLEIQKADRIFNL